MTENFCATGLARRSDNYETLLEQCAQGRGVKLSLHEAIRAATLVSKEVSSGAGMLLVTYVTYLDFSDIRKSAVWPGHETLKLALGVSDATLRRHKAELEKTGLLLRNYDARNRPVHGDAIDLTPFLEKVPTILCDHKKALETLKAERTQSRLMRIDLDQVESTLSAQLRKTECHRNSGQDNVGIILDEENIKNFQTALQISRKLNDFLSKKQADTLETALQIVPDGLDHLLQTKTSANCRHTWIWAVNKFGAGGAFLRLAITLATPKVRSLSRYFGRLITSHEIDISVNVERLLEAQAKVQPDLPTDEGSKGEGASPVTDFTKVLLQSVDSVADFNSWFGASHVDYEDTEGFLILRVRNELVKREIVDRYGPHLTKARETLGWTSKKIRLDVASER